MQRLALFLRISKVRIATMVAIMTALGFYLGADGSFSGRWQLLACTLIGTFFSSMGAAALNCYIERDIDRLMKRTSGRPLATGEMAAHEALAYGIICVLGAVAFLVWTVNLLTAFLALLTAFLYVLVYTPLKRITWLNTFIGAIPGALPPVGGWAAATGNVSFDAWLLFLILFVWQHPHFFAIAWIYKEDYARAGFKMLPVIDEDGKRTMRQVFFYSVLLIPVSVLPSFYGVSGSIYFVGALILSWMMFIGGVFFMQSKSIADARKLLLASIIYLPGLFILIVCDSFFTI